MSHESSDCAGSESSDNTSESVSVHDAFIEQLMAMDENRNDDENRQMLSREPMVDFRGTASDDLLTETVDTIHSHEPMEPVHQVHPLRATLHFYCATLHFYCYTLLNAAFLLNHIQLLLRFYCTTPHFY